MPVYNAGTVVVYAPNSSAYRAIFTTYGLDVYSPANATVWQLLGPCSAGTAPQSVDPPSASRDSEILQSVVAGPNISRQGEPIQFHMNLAEAAKVELFIYTLMSELVYQAPFEGNAGSHTLVWDIRNLCRSGDPWFKDLSEERQNRHLPLSQPFQKPPSGIGERGFFISGRKFPQKRGFQRAKMDFGSPV
jgi:hypothetical protein